MAIEELRRKLSRILLRRNRDTILRAALPRRSTVIVACRATGAQEEAYLSECASVLSSLGRDREVAPEELVVADADADADQEEDKEAISGESSSRLQTEVDASQSEVAERSTKRKGVRSNDTSSEKAVLASLMCLRQICSGGAEPAAPQASVPTPSTSTSTVTTTTAGVTTAAEALARREEAVARALNNSVKLRVSDSVIIGAIIRHIIRSIFKWFIQLLFIYYIIGT